ncbi:C4-dicarboxylate ABC transporter [Parazoarcus communis]|jgi:tripartite ATP-independent transporter DctM subunit|uniref:TRAP transporter large permease protein n=1 Tax=Parazoarcus communis TaxID=41977 RepID=A0A2U8HA53_9RHOO|nr:TRAP transporter large permease [Parazoarcus communis]AWI81635.1 C4-dicarboxylate ABC transporter [Parazoarcus communis]
MDFMLTQGTAMTLGVEFYAALALLGFLVLIGTPIWVSLGLGTLAMVYATGVIPTSMVGEGLFEGIDHFALIAVPLFILTGDALVRSGLSDKLLDLAEASVGGVRTGLGCSTTLGCGFFACISGSDAAGAAAVGRMTINRLVERGYPLPAAAALVASGACTGILIPPSIAYIIIGLVLGISVSTLFLAALIPGIMIMFSVMVTNVILNRVHGFEQGRSSFSLQRWLQAIWAARWALAVPGVILGGIYSGVFTPTESAAAAVTITVLIGFHQKRLGFADIPKMLESSAKVCGIIVPIIAVSLPLAQIMAVLDIPQSFVQTISGISSDPTMIILMMIGLLLITGLFMETTPSILIMSPLLLPLAQSLGMSEIHFSIIMVTTLGIGFITPPFGLNLFVLSGLTGCSVMSMSRYAIPYVLGMLAVVLLVAFIPQLSMWGIPG